MERKIYLGIVLAFLTIILLSTLSNHVNIVTLNGLQGINNNLTSRSPLTSSDGYKDSSANQLKTISTSKRIQSSRSNVDKKICWVNLFDNSENTSWISTGNSPYLHNSTDDYIMSVTVGNCSWFHFQDTNLTQSQNVYLMIEWRARFIKPLGEAKLFLDNGVAEEDLGPFDLSLEFRWTQINITHILETVSKINDAKLKISSQYTGLYLVTVRRAYLKMFNGPVPLIVDTVGFGKPSSAVTLSVYWTDQDGLSSYALNHNASGAWLTSNFTAPLTGKTGWSNYTITLPNDTASVLAYRFWANDTNNNWEETEVLDVCVLKNYSPELLQMIDNSTGSPIAHSYGRKDFYDNETGRFWKFHSDGINMKYSSTIDGQSWTTPQVVRSASFGFQFYVHCSNQIVHYVYNSELTGHDLYYRSGMLNINGTIRWRSPEQVVAFGDTSKRFYACSLVADTDGYPYVVFGNRTDSSFKTLNLIRSDYNNGTWETTNGFPIQINENPDSDLVSGVTLSLPNSEVYVVYCSAGNEEPPRGRLWNTSHLGSIEDASAFTMSSNYPFCAVSDIFGNVHLAYRRTIERLDYSFRNYSTGSWEVKDEFVTSYLTTETLDATTYSWPVVGWNPDSEEVYLHWWTFEDKSGWLKFRNTTGWGNRRRILKLDCDLGIIDGDTIAPLSHQNRILINFVVQNVISGQEAVYGYIYLNRQPRAGFSISNETVYTAESIFFNASESFDPDGYLVSHSWDFGDNYNATGTVVEHSYTDDGNYTIILTVIDDSGASNNTSATVLVLNRPPVASFTESTETAFTGETIIFNASQSFDPDGVIVKYFWDFDDGENATGLLVDHSYLENGSYNVTLTVTDDDNVEGNISSTKTILNRAPIALFTESTEVASTDEVIFFNASQSYDLDGYIVNYFWNFGDGLNATGLTVEHFYSDNGSYTVTLFVTDDDDAEGNATATKTILQHNVAILDLSPFKTVVGEGFNLGVNITVANIGDYLETLNITLFANMTVVSAENVTLNAGGTASTILIWNTSSFLKGNYTLSAQVAPVPGEKKFEDNMLIDGWTFITIPGDVDADRDVDIFDIVAIIGAYQSSEGDPRYVSNYDINSDGEVDIFDIVIATSNYKESW